MLLLMDDQMNKAYIIMGVSGAGKSTIGALVAEQLDVPFVEGDDFHPRENVDKMSSGQALTNDDRRAWIEQLAGEINTIDGHSVASCSALNDVVRNWLNQHIKAEVCFVCLQGSRALLLERLRARKGHFFKDDMLDSQLQAFDLPEGAICVDIDASPEEISANIMRKISAEANI